MKNNIKITLLASGLFLMVFASQAQSREDNTMALAYGYKKAPEAAAKVTEQASSMETVNAVDYPTVSFPETAGFVAEKEKAFYRLSWQVLMRETLSYTEIQGSSDGLNFTTVGFVVNDGTGKSTNFDYFVPSDKNGVNTFRLVQHGLNAQKHTSEVLKVN